VEALARFLAARPLPAAIVGGAASPAALAAIRSLASAGAPVVAVDHRRGAVGFRSRFAFPAVCPHPARERAAFFAFLEELSGQLDRAAPVFPVDARYREAFTAAEERLPGRLLVAPPGPAAEGAREAAWGAYWELLGARPDAAPVDAPPRRSLARLDPGPAIAGALRFARGHRL
jgi:hypothetical protein